MRVTIAIDSFKGSATSKELNEVVKKAFLDFDSTIKAQAISISDGGEGTLSALAENFNGQIVMIDTIDLLRRPIQGSYLIVEDCAFIETAQIVGIEGIQPSLETYELATTFGLGALFLDAIERGCQTIYLTLGGSGTSDGGLGFLDSLGFEEQEADFSIFDRYQNVKLIGLTDVQNPYYGENGYAHIFGKQKGGNMASIQASDEKAQNFAQTVLEKTGINLQELEGTGAAGGLGGAIAIIGGSLKSGFTEMAELLKLEKWIKNSDLVITGEGQLDLQSKAGKVPVGLSSLARRHGVPIIAICGSISSNFANTSDYFDAAFSIQRQVLPLEVAMEKNRTLENTYLLAKNIISLFLLENK